MDFTITLNVSLLPAKRNIIHVDKTCADSYTVPKTFF